jgi:hypothetical protein
MIIPAFIQRCDRYCAMRRIKRATLSTMIFNDGKRLEAVANGANVGVLTLERAQLELTRLEQGAQQDAAA